MQKEFEALITSNNGRIRYIASRYSRGSERDDIYQEILMQLWRSFESFEGKSTAETWVYKVALNTSFAYVRKSKKQSEVFVTNSASDQAKQPTEQVSQGGTQADILETFMDSLNDIDANILMMYLDALSSEQMADVLGISGNAVRSRVKRIKLQFEQEFIEVQA